jgi:hypothetical protein
MWAAFDTYLIDITWVPRMSWKNDTDMTQTYSYSCTTGLTITSGSELNNGFSLGAIYKGASVIIDRQERVFKPTETTESRTMTMNLSVPPRSLLIFYQRRYRFRNSIFFIFNAWGRDWNVGRWKGQPEEKAMKECKVEIMSEDYMTMQALNQLGGTRIINVKTVDGVQGVPASKTWDDCTNRCKDKLRAMYV